MGTSAPSTMVDRWLEELDDKLEELRPAYDEFMQLTDFRARLTGTSPAPPSGRGSRARSTGSRAAASGNSGDSNSGSGTTRKQQYLTLIKERPGITVKEACTALDVQDNYIYRLRKELTKEGLIRIDGSGVYPIGDADKLAAREAELAASSRG